MAKLRREITAMKTGRDTKRASRAAQRRAVASRSPATPTPASPRCSTGSPAPACSSRTSCSPPSTRPCAGPRPPTAGSTRSPTPSASCASLPHQLVEAFRSTLEEVADSDLLLHVVDGSHPDPEGQISAVREVLAEVGGDQIKEIIVVNKADAADPEVLDRLGATRSTASSVSARTGAGPRRAAGPHRRGAAAARHRGRRARARTTAATWSAGCTRRPRSSPSEHTEHGTRVEAKVDRHLAGDLEAFAV